MMKKMLLFCFFVAVIVVAGCTDKHEYPAGAGVSGESSCITCHASEDNLRLVAEPDSSSGSSSGEG